MYLDNFVGGPNSLLESVYITNFLEMSIYLLVLCDPKCSDDMASRASFDVRFQKFFFDANINKSFSCFGLNFR